MLTRACMLAVMRQQAAFGETGFHKFGGPEPAPRKREGEQAHQEPKPGSRVRVWDDTVGNYVYRDIE